MRDGAHPRRRDADPEGRLTPRPADPDHAPEPLAAAGALLRANDRGGWTRSATVLYPHQWSWDSAIVAIGWAHLDSSRAMAELEGLFAAQWSNGKLPHMVFHAGAEHYQPGPELWDSRRSPSAPATQPTSGLAAPPIHALAAATIWRMAIHAGPRMSRRAEAFAARVYPPLMAWHRYLAEQRDPEGSGLLTIYHPWESLDNAPQWDAPLAELEVGEVGTYRRHDLHVTTAEERPRPSHYKKYIWLVERMRNAGYDDASIGRTHPFQIKDVFVSALFVAASEGLLELAGVVGAPDADRAEIEGWLQTGRRGLAATWDEEFGLCLCVDLVQARTLRARTVAGLSPLMAGPDAAPAQALIEQLDSTTFAGHPSLRWRLPPSASPLDPGFERRNYWRGPVWPVVNWLLWLGLRRCGAAEAAEQLRREALDQVRNSALAEYFDPFSGEPLGAAGQSWTAAVVIDWLSAAA